MYNKRTFWVNFIFLLNKWLAFFAEVRHLVFSFIKGSFIVSVFSYEFEMTSKSWWSNHQSHAFV